MPVLRDLFSPAILELMVDQDFVSRRFHPTAPYAILNYTDKCTYDREWNDVTQNCRGLIYNTETLEVVARPFPKFFNYGEPGAPEFDLNDEVEVVDKVDGSLGIIYQLPDGNLAVATRGSFESDQAKWATAHLREKYSTWGIPGNFTDLVEIVYAENRIVLDYEFEGLVFLCSIYIPTGEVAVGRIPDWPGPSRRSFGWMKFRDALAMPPRDNAEGVVIRKGNDLVKLKQEDYVRLHKVVFGLNARAVWEVLSSGADFEEYLTSLPEEFREWADKCGYELSTQFAGKRNNAYVVYSTISRELGPEYTRKEFAEKALAQGDTNASWLFNILDGKSIDEAVWKAVYPSHRWAPREVSEE